MKKFIKLQEINTLVIEISHTHTHTHVLQPTKLTFKSEVNVYLIKHFNETRQFINAQFR